MKLLKILSLFLTSLFIMGCTTPIEDTVNPNDKEDIDPNNENEGEDNMNIENCNKNNEIVLNKTDTVDATELWNNGSVCENLKLENGLIKLVDISSKGTYESAAFKMESFKELVPSWNVLIDDESAVTFLFAIGNSNGFSDYYTLAYWREGYKTSFSNQEDDYGKVYIDTIVTKSTDIDQFKVKIVFKKTDSDATALKSISVTSVYYNDTNNFDTSPLLNKEITVQPRQQLSVPSIGNSICSPTSVSMVMTYYNHNETQSEVAGLIYDEGAQIYGNWSFNASYPGGFSGIYSRVEYVNDLGVLMNYINEDTPVVLSIKTTSKDQLEGSIMAYPAGHLIVLIGFQEMDGVWYGIVNDPAEYEDNAVRRLYNLEQLLAAWRGYTYIIQDKPFE